ncbi:hypothetical protein DIS24_g7424 [Lasiodiplodia hormozganensis]|uniref:Uncharacterized protein n=1 Tax=Lasiodiplodia hormozganensis TaxID=869390 RepID=A0AA40CRB8_9PEZI|nr:hypothetical protein DIS24_g7424 [Lasiodiplodia hormozganensis]
MSTLWTSSSSVIAPAFQSVLFEELLPGQAGDSDVVTQGTKIQMIMEELEKKYACIYDDLKRGRYDITNWDSIRNLPVVYDGCEQVDTITTLMVHHAVQTLDSEPSFFVPGSSGKIRPCSNSCGFMFVGLHKHTYIRGAVGNVVPMPNEPPNAEEDAALNVVASYCQRLGFLPADPSLEHVEALQTEALKNLRKSEAELFTGQLIMERAMRADKTRDNDHDGSPLSAQQSQFITMSSDVQGKAPVTNRRNMNNATTMRDQAINSMKVGLNILKWRASLKWMPVQTPDSMSRSTAAEPSEDIAADSEYAFEEVAEPVKPVFKRARVETPDPDSLNDEAADGRVQHRTPTPVSSSSSSDSEASSSDEQSSRSRYTLKSRTYRSPYTPRRKYISARPQASSSSPATPGSSNMPTSTSEVLRDARGLITGARGFRTVAPLPRFVANGEDQSDKLVLHYWQDDKDGVPRFHTQRYRPRGALKDGIDWADEAHMATLNRWAMQQVLRKGAARARPSMREREWVPEETAFLRELADKHKDDAKVVRKDLFDQFNEKFADKDVEVTGRDGVKKVMRRFRRTNEALTSHAERTGAFAALKGKWGRRGAVAVKEEPTSAEDSGLVSAAEGAGDVTGSADDDDDLQEEDTDGEM